MKVIYVVLNIFILAGVFAGDSLETFLDDEIHKTAECIRYHLINGYEDNNVPSFDPLSIEEYDVDLTNVSYVDGPLLLRNITLIGVPEFYLTNETLDVSTTTPIGGTLELTVNMDNLFATADYEVDASIVDMIPVNGIGTIHLQISNLKVPARLVVGVSNAEEVSVQLSIDDVSLSITGLQNDEYLSSVISTQIKSLVMQVLDELEAEVNDFATGIAVYYLGDYNLEQLLKLIVDIQNTCIGFDLPYWNTENVED